MLSRRQAVARGGLCGLLAAAAAVAAGELAAAVVGASSAPVVAVGSAAIDLTPTPLKEFAVREFGTNDKLILLSGIYSTLGLIAIVAGILAIRRLRLGLALVGLFGLVAAIAALSRPGTGPLSVLPGLLAGLAGGYALTLLIHRATPPATADAQLKQVDADTPARPVEVASVGSGGGGATALVLEDDESSYDGPEGGAPKRRSFLLAAGATAGTAAVAGVAGRVVQNKRFSAAESREGVTLPAPRDPARAFPPGATSDVPGISPFVTANADFYRVDTNLVLPQVPADTWSLKVHGMVDKPFEISFDELLSRDLVERTITLSCVSNEVGGPYVGTAKWLGFPLADLLREAGVKSGADQVVSTSSDGSMTIGSPTDVVMDGRDALICVGMNGEPLPVAHGFPARLLVPGLYGYASATKWVVDLELTTFDAFDAYWVRRDWAREGPVRTASRIDVPKPLSQVKAGKVTVAGVAYAQHTGVEEVQVRVDSGEWNKAELTTQVTPDIWRQWTWEWEAQAGLHTIEVRAVDAKGDVQEQERRTPFPSGATGWHSSVVTVT